MRRAHVLLMAVAAVLTLALVTDVAPTQAAGGRSGGYVTSPVVTARGSDPFIPGRSYTGDFPDPNILRVGTTYYAYATNTSNLNLPTMQSKDMRTWTAIGDTFPRSGGWAASSGGRRTRTWAPSVTYVRDHYVLAYTAPVRKRGARKNCVGLASGPSARGPFSDPHGGPVVCPGDQGAIDPQVYVTAAGTPYLIWKTEGVIGRAPTKFWSRRLDADGLSFADGSEETELLRTALSWEGHVIENPTMIRVNGLTYLFYSANEFIGPNYATGYAICASVSGPCERPSSEPLLASGGDVSGPGGPTPFMDAGGHLRLGYAAWSPGRTGYPRGQRRLHVATLSIDPDGLLHVADRG